ncbi:MAG: molybdate ABC transporter substrate-binding protein [Gammaproteobacteria bacterium]
MRRARACVMAVLLHLCAPAAGAAEATVAVAANFLVAMETLATDFARASGHTLVLAAGSTGKLYAQIAHDAPYDVFLAADQARPAALENGPRAVAGTRFTYAVGALVLWSRDAALLASDMPAAVLAGPAVRHIAIANPDLAPYGVAAAQTLDRLGMGARVRDKLVTAQNVGEAYSMVATGNAEVGFVARASVVDPRHAPGGSRWDVPPGLHAPIRQDAVLLRHGADNPAARALLEFLRTPAAAAVMQRHGYRTE